MSEHTMTLRAAVIQMSPGPHKTENLQQAEHWITQAVAAGAQLVSLPETFIYSGPHEIADMQRVAEPLSGITSKALSQWAKTHGVYVLGGSFFEINAEDLARPFNTSVVYGPTGKLLAKYRKNHLFCLQAEHPHHKDMSEAAYQTAGERQDRAVAPTPWGGIGLSICYDLRFPLLYQQYSRTMGATMVAVPSKFLKTTGEAHWLPLLQARAIENQCYVIAANAYSEENPANYGHSMIVDPWGKVLAQVESGEGFAIATLNFDYLHHVRKRLPVLDPIHAGRNHTID